MTNRRQFTSCDACRKSRIRCDAANRDGSCSNCARRKKTCSFQWIEHFTGGRYRHSSERSTPRGPRPTDRETSIVSSMVETVPDTEGRSVWQPAPSAHLDSTTNRRQHALTLHHVLWDIFTSLYEPQLGLWIGTDCNPFKRINTAPKTLITRLMVLLDSTSTWFPSKATAMKLGLPDVQIPPGDAVTQDRLINQALISAVHAFSARWLPLSCFGEVNPPKSPHLLIAKEHFVECIWKRAQKDVEKVLTIPSYRSILALYLFGVTPTSSKNAERQIADYCMETALRHYVRLRARKCIAASSVVSVSSDMTQDFGGNDRIIGIQDANEEHQHLEDTAYWFGIVIDGSRALTRCQPSVLLPGLTGDSRVWDLIKKQSANSDTVFDSISSAKTLLTDQTVTIMVQYGFQCKTLFWKAVSRLQECLFYQSIEVSLPVVLGDIEREITRLEKNYTPFLDKCGRDYILLSIKSRINYLILSFHFHLGILILVDTLDWHHEVSQRDPIIDVEAHRLSSTRAIVTSINLMLSQSDIFAGDDPTSIILKDPYPEHTRNGLSRAAYSVLKMYASLTLPKQVAEIMASSLFAGLEVLKQISYSATESLNDLYQEFAKSDLTLRPRQPVPSTNLTAVPSTYEVALTPELFEEATFRQLDLAGEDPFLVNKTIGRHEKNEQSDDFAWFDLDGADLEWMSQDWSFQDCFSSA